jgi:hypothetical protein
MLRLALLMGGGTVAITRWRRLHAHRFDWLAGRNAD